MKLKYATLRNQLFVMAMRKLTNYPFKAQKIAYDVMKISNKIDQEMKHSQELFIKLLKQYAQLDDKGEFVRMQENGKEIPDTFMTIPGKEEEFGKAQEEFAEVEFEIKWRPLAFEALEDCRFSSVEFSMLGELIAPPADSSNEEPAPIR